ncbi:hypothetical protein KJB99_10245 [Staphylococcus epidermidis]|uniref:hypothetical protein n=1 Tax=Staphylococcus epidermidis TaxID=1282 RepID=UPI001F445074|nr:hypothetical protein [Staphylococcus epidermidis]MCE5030071.1 hypothetical protein [Staphylococcus epidermidis]MCE5032377.1 hypothetical protein [Staphylococcus epidermidis]
MKREIYEIIESQLNFYEGNAYLAEVLEDRYTSGQFEIKDAIELYSSYLRFLGEEQDNDFNRFEVFNYLFNEMRNLLDSYNINFNSNDTNNYLEYLKENYLEEKHIAVSLDKTEKVDDVEVLNRVIELGAKSAVEKMNEITEELSKDITDNKKASLLAEQNKYIQALKKYFENK